MSKKHFIAFAEKIREMVHTNRRVEANTCANMVISVARDANPNFNPDTFLIACGLRD